MPRTEIITDGSCIDPSRSGGWAAVILHHASGSQPNTSSREMELRAVVGAIKMAEGPCTIICDHGGIVSAAQEGKTPEWCKPLWEELYAAMVGKDIAFEWRRRHDTLGQRLAHQLAREATRKHGRV